MFYEFEFFMPKDYLDFSKELSWKPDDFNCGISALKRTIYSRAYYSAFLHVREWLIQYDKYKSTSDDHSDIPEHIRSNGPFDSVKNMEIASNLELLKSLRQQADYYIKREDALRYKHVWMNESIEEALNLVDEIFRAFSKINLN